MGSSGQADEKRSVLEASVSAFPLSLLPCPFSLVTRGLSSASSPATPAPRLPQRRGGATLFDRSPKPTIRAQHNSSVPPHRDRFGCRRPLGDGPGPRPGARRQGSGGRVSAGRLRERHSASLRAVLRGVSRPLQGAGPVAVAHAGVDPERRPVGSRGPAGQQPQQRADAPGARPERRRPHAARRRSAAGGDHRAASRLDRSGRADAREHRGGGGDRRALGVCEAVASRAAGRRARGLGPHRDRSIRAGAARAREADAVARGLQADAAAPRHARPHRPAADAGGARRLSRRHRPRRLRARGRPAARVAALRRTVGAALARPGALRRHQRLREGQPPRYLEVSRLGDRRVQSRPAVRSVHRRTDRRRHAAERRPSSRRSPPGSIATR